MQTIIFVDVFGEERSPKSETRDPRLETRELITENR